MSTTLLILGMLLFLLVAAMLMARIGFSDAICKPAIRAWARREKIDYAFDEPESLERLCDRGPFLFRSLNTQRVYRLLVTRDGKECVAYVRVGHWLVGLLYPVVSMRWNYKGREEENV